MAIAMAKSAAGAAASFCMQLTFCFLSSWCVNKCKGWQVSRNRHTNQHLPIACHDSCCCCSALKNNKQRHQSHRVNAFLSIRYTWIVEKHLEARKSNVGEQTVLSRHFATAWQSAADHIVQNSKVLLVNNKQMLSYFSLGLPAKWQTQFSTYVLLFLFPVFCIDWQLMGQRTYIFICCGCLSTTWAASRRRTQACFVF